MDRAHQDHLACEALSVTARKGIELALDEDERRELTERGYSEADLKRIDEYQVILGRDAATEPVENRIRRRVAGIAGNERISGHEFCDAKRIWLNGRAAALLSSKAGLDRGFDGAMSMAGRLRDGRVTDTTAYQIRKTTELLHEATGIEAAETAGRNQGLSAATINRNFGFVGQLMPARKD